MKIQKLLTPALMLLALTSCSVLEVFNEEKSKNHSSQNIDHSQEKRPFCQVPHINSQLITEDKEALEFYKTLENQILKNTKYSFIDKSIMISLIELARRPDQIGPHSRFQIYIKLDNKNYYYDFRPKDLAIDHDQPFLVALEFLAKKFQKHHTLNQLVADLEVVVPKDLPVSKDFEFFLRQNNKLLLKNDLFYENFFKGDEVVTKYETFKRQSFKKTMALYPKAKKLEYYNYDASDIFNNHGPYKCNFKINDEMSFLKNDSNHEMKKSHSIGFIQDNNIFIGVASFEIDPSFTNEYKDFYYFKANHSKKPYPFCVINKNANEYALFSSKGRNPEQFMQHLLSYEIENSTEHQEVNQILNFSRHLVLSNPDRILYESKKGRKSQLNFFLTMNFPVYHVEALGNIFGHAIISKVHNNKPILHIDTRDEGQLWCK